ncbi:MAG: ROK family protein, partial [Planctomycetes bacterium]|nr:ROK family protein [Planctomycetota bacterium]
MTDESKLNRWIGLDIGGTKLLGAAVTDNLKILGTVKRETLRDEGPEAVFGRVREICRALIQKYGPVSGVGAGFAGLV